MPNVTFTFFCLQKSMLHPSLHVDYTFNGLHDISPKQGPGNIQAPSRKDSLVILQVQISGAAT
jgi:hypothetical protein